MTLHTCPCCRHQFTEDEEQDANLAARVAALEAECAAEGYPIRDGRVSEEHAAKLLGCANPTLRSYRKNRTGPRAHHLPVNSSRWSYRLVELAAWEAAQQEGESWI